jgi:putative ABC transport system permease protein
MRPSYWRRIPGGWRYVLRVFARRPEDDVDAELQFHFDESAAELRAQGLSPRAARARARAEFGDVDAVRTRLHEIGQRAALRRRRAAWWESAAQDLRFALRGLRRSPGFTGVATLSLAIGIGLSAATFAIVDSMLNPKIPIANVDHLFHARLRFGNQRNPPPLPEQVRALQGLPGVERVGAMAPDGEQRTIVANGRQFFPGIVYYTQNFFPTIGVTMGMGRFPSDDEVRAKSVVVLSNTTWRSMFPKRDSLAGALVSIDGQEYPVVGVLPPGLESLIYGHIWMPATSVADMMHMWSPTVIVRLGGATDSIRVRPQLAAIASSFTAAYAPPPAPPYLLQLQGLRPRPPNLRDNELALLLVGIAVGVLAISCTNVSALALARGLARRRDYALRVALGASRLAIGGMVLSEVALLGLVGAVLGFMLAMALIGAVTHMVPEDLTLRGFFIPALTARVFAMTTATLLGGILVAGGIPAWRAARANPSDPLKDNAGTTTGRARSEFKILVIGELSIAMALLMLASLLTLSTRNLVNYDFGFDARSLVRALVAFPGGRDSLATDRKEAALRASVSAVSGMHGVAAVTTAGAGRFEDDRVMSDAGRGEDALILRRGFVEAGPQFFATIGAPLISGRDFVAGDRARGAVILSNRAAKLLFPHDNALGHAVKLGGERSARAWLTVIGIARDIKINLSPDPDATADTTIYATTPDRSPDYSSLVIRPVGNAPTLNVDIARTLHDGLPPHSISGVEPFAGNYDSMIRRERFYDRVFSFLSGASVLLAAAGLFSIMSYTVGRRLREFAVRQALGASPREVLRLVLRGAFELALGGTAFGALLSFWASAGVSTVLFGVKNTDPVSLVIAELTLLTVTMLASLVPAVRAMRADPVEVLRAT